MPKRKRYDALLFLDGTLLALCGLIVVGSASNFVAMDFGKSPSAFLVRHLVFLVAGFGIFFVAMRVPVLSWDRRKPLMVTIGVCVALLLVVLAMPAIGGARRWIPLGPFNVQPSELAKLLTVVFMASVLSRREDEVNEFWRVPLPCGIVVGAFAFLIVIEPDLGSAVMLVLVAGVMAFLAGLSWKYICAAGTLGALAFAVSVAVMPYRWVRIEAYVQSLLDRGADPLGAHFQLNQSLIAIGSGGLTGTGLGQGQQKALYVPAVHTDFILAAVGEEFGLVGTLGLLVAFLVIYWRGMRAAHRVADRFGFYLAAGLTNLLVLQALINMGVCLGLLPTKGLPLPLISYGGSSLLASMAAMGLLINVSRHAD